MGGRGLPEGLVFVFHTLSIDKTGARVWKPPETEANNTSELQFLRQIPRRVRVHKKSERSNLNFLDGQIW